MPTTWLGGKRAVVTVNGSDPMAIEDGSYTTTAGVDEVTNLLSGGFYEDIATIKRATVSLRAVYNGSDPPEFNEGDIVDLSVSVPGTAQVTGPPLIPAVPGGPLLSGNFRVTSMTYPIVNPRAAVRYTFEASSNGAYVKGTSPNAA